MLTDRQIHCVLVALALAGCDAAGPTRETSDMLSRDLADGNVAGIGDPMVASALQAPLMSDPMLAQSANADTIRPPSRPDPEGVPTDITGPKLAEPATINLPAPAACPDCAAARTALTAVALAAMQTDRVIATCASRLRYSAEWADRLPRGLALYPDARVQEAAGTDADGCRVRVARYASSASATTLAGWYHAMASAGGWRATYRADADLRAVTGQRTAGAYRVYIAPHAGGGSDVSLVASGN